MNKHHSIKEINKDYKRYVFDNMEMLLSKINRSSLRSESLQFLRISRRLFCKENNIKLELMPKLQFWNI